MELAPHNKCTACMACIDACAHKVLESELDTNGYYRIKINPDRQCSSCGMCTRSCPVLTPPNNTSSTKDGFAPCAYAVWTDNDSLRSQCASGGAFGAMASRIIGIGGVAYGAAIDGFRIRHHRAETIEQLIGLLGSKYQQSETNGVYRQVRDDLRQGRIVLFSGLSCQVAGLIAYLGKTPHDNLITIDTICGGLSTMLPMLALEKTGKYTGIHSFRDKEHGWRPKGFRYDLKMNLPDGGIEDLGFDNYILSTFSSKLLKRSACLDCKFNGYNRVADITIGDFWGDSSHPEQHAKGLSVAIVRSKRGLRIVEQSLNTSPTKIDKITPYNPNLLQGHYPLVRYTYLRKIALSYMRDGKYDKLKPFLSHSSLAGVYIRLLTKLSKLLCK